MRNRLESLLAGAMGALLMAMLVGPFVQNANASYVPVPSGTIAYYNTTSCPNGWTEFTTGRGRYIVGLLSGGTLASGVGTALTNQENRPAGSHNHAITDPAHGHAYQVGGTSNWSLGNTPVALASQISPAWDGSSQFGNPVIRTATTGITINAGGGGSSGETGTTGTNAPYIQLLMCSKS